MIGWFKRKKKKEQEADADRERRFKADRDRFADVIRSMAQQRPRGNEVGQDVDRVRADDGFEQDRLQRERDDDDSRSAAEITTFPLGDHH